MCNPNHKRFFICQGRERSKTRSAPNGREQVGKRSTCNGIHGHGIDKNRHYAVAQYINSIQFNVDLQAVGVQNMPYCIIMLNFLSICLSTKHIRM